MGVQGMLYIFIILGAELDSQLTAVIKNFFFLVTEIYLGSKAFVWKPLIYALLKYIAIYLRAVYYIMLLVTQTTQRRVSRN